MHEQIELSSRDDLFLGLKRLLRITGYVTVRAKQTDDRLIDGYAAFSSRVTEVNADA